MAKKKVTEKEVREIIADIAKEVLEIETLETRNSDSLDFHEVSVWRLAEALTEALYAGAGIAKAGYEID